ncbi:3-hydroxyacyl-CoA dehydrogenase family protein [Paraliomyxa miuraensis]|uniref:3-hydroxyacyl-CoA dehydrogenase family protein n=1 Tax=Paraliomyxa miuraensis TaxID=376150 RepID=UPI002257D9D1|nr:3-hydroxyacyl-CoA dehydrogenase family protein [Paraliomyxa miuraensis]MCX4243035.1 3-hydroxyacyl-CoA dehydrogenase family protein [Paraliomyxa miuraensis]
MSPDTENTRSVAVVGVGNIGTTVCADLLLWGFGVVAVDIDTTRLERARVAVERAIRFAPALRPQLPRPHLDEALGRLEMTTNLDAVGGCGVIVENVPEKWEAKESVYRRLDRISTGILAANTSCISITRLGALLADPGRVAGLHFMNPAYLSEAVEVVRGHHTTPETVDRCTALARALGKEAVVVEDLPGFASNRVSHLFMNEAAWIVHDGVATPEAVDRLFCKGFGHRMGPLATADLIGLDTVVDTLDMLAESYGDPKFRVCPLLRKMVDAGSLGRKSCRGFFEYPAS